MTELIKQTGRTPISFVHGDTVLLITAFDIQNAFQIPFYSPAALFEDLASGLADLIEGNYSGFVHHLIMPRPSELCSLDADSNGKEAQQAYTWEWDATLSVLCGDAEPIIFDATSFEYYIAELRNQSSLLGGMWAGIRLQCSGWQIRPKYRFTGPFQSSLSGEDRDDAGLEAPLLFLSSRFDPATPLANAYSMSALHPGSAVLVQDSVGHSALGSAPSECTWEVVRDYLETGKLPNSGTICHADEKPFSSVSSLRSSEWWRAAQWRARKTRTRQWTPM